MALSALAAGPASAADKVLSYTLVGLDGTLRQNALAWLGAAPDSPQDRLNFLATAEERVENSLKALGYYHPDISMELQRTEPEWLLTITVDTGKPVLIRHISIEVTGPAGGDVEFQRLRERAPFREGDVFSHGDYERFKNQLLTLGQERGYFDAGFSASRVEVNVVGDTADIFLHYDSGPRFRFGAVSYSETRIEHGLLTALQPFREGDYFDQSRLQLFQAGLQRTRYFSSVVIKPLFDRVENHQVPVSIMLHPAQRHSFDVGLGYSTDTQERVSAIWRTPLINRFGHSQETRISYSVVNPSGRFTYTIPMSHPLDDVIHISASLEDNKYGDIKSRQQEVGTLRETRKGKWLFGFSGRFLDESWELKSTMFNNNYFLPGFALSRSDRSGSLVDPSGGFSQFYKVEGGSDRLGSDIDLLRATANLSYILTPAPQHRVVTRAAVGTVLTHDSDRTDLAPSLGFFAGGSQSIRGYGYQSIGNEIKITRENGTKQTLVVGGDRLVTATVEYQYYFSDRWRGALFVDAGDAFDSGEFNLNVGPGFGIHYLSPVGAARLEFANGISEDNPSWRLVLNIGAEF